MLGVDGGVPPGIDRGTTAQEITYNPLLEYVRLKPNATVLIRSGSMLAARPFRFIVIALCLAAPALIAQVPSASDPPKYVMPPKNIVDVFDAEPLPQVLISPNRQAVALTKARTYPTIAELPQPMLRLAGSRINPKANRPHRATALPGTRIYW